MLSGSKIIGISSIAAVIGSFTASVTDSHSSTYTLKETLTNAALGCDVRLYYLASAPAMTAGTSGYANTGTFTSMTDDAKSGLWTTNQWTGAAYKNIITGETATVTTNNTTGTLNLNATLSQQGNGTIYALNDYIISTANQADDYYGAVWLEITGCSSIIDTSAAQGDYGNSASFNSGTKALGSNPALLVGFGMNDADNGTAPFVPLAGGGATNDGTALVFDIGPIVRIQHANLSNPGTAGMTFTTQNADHDMAFMAAFLENPVGPLPRSIFILP